jgi:hypothetical protein
MKCFFTDMATRNSSMRGTRPSLAVHSFTAVMISSLLTVFLLVGPHSRAAFAGTRPFRVLCGKDGLGVNGQNQKNSFGVAQTAELFFLLAKSRAAKAWACV